jgi:hypothetical protein
MIASRQIAFGKAAGAKPAYWVLCFTAEEAGSTVTMTTRGNSPPTVTLETSYDGEIWEPFTVNITTIMLPAVGDKVFFRAGEGGNQCLGLSRAIYNYFVMTGRVAASGSIMSLLNGINPTFEIPDNNYCFAYLFNNCASLTKAPELPAVRLVNYCYFGMFSGCTSLTKAPELPATTLAGVCYSYMFSGCTALIQAPMLYAVTTTTNCYNNMFVKCSSLNHIVTKQTSFSGCQSWLSNVSSNGTFVCPTVLGTNETITRGVSACPEGWTVVNED